MGESELPITCSCLRRFATVEEWEKHSRLEHPSKWKSVPYNISTAGGYFTR